MSNPPFLTSEHVRSQVASALEQLASRIDAFGFAVWPLINDDEHGIPAGFLTVGFTKIGLPEFYVSGIPAYGKEGAEIIKNLRELHAYAHDNSLSTNALDFCNSVNMRNAVDDKPLYQWRPVDADRLLYGQATILRNWVESVGLTSLVQGIQIVHRNSPDVDFPMYSTPNQLLLDWVPFGTKHDALTEV